MTEPTLMTIAKISAACWRGLERNAVTGDDLLPITVDWEFVENQLRLCDAVIESEIRREEFEWLKHFEKLVRGVNELEDPDNCFYALENPIDWLDKQRSDREGPQA